MPNVFNEIFCVASVFVLEKKTFGDFLLFQLSLRVGRERDFDARRWYAEWL